MWPQKSIFNFVRTRLYFHEAATHELQQTRFKPQSESMADSFESEIPPAFHYHCLSWEFGFFFCSLFAVILSLISMCHEAAHHFKYFHGTFPGLRRDSRRRGIICRGGAEKWCSRDLNASHDAMLLLLLYAFKLSFALVFLFPFV